MSNLTCKQKSGINLYEDDETIQLSNEVVLREIVIHGITGDLKTEGIMAGFQISVVMSQTVYGLDIEGIGKVLDFYKESGSVFNFAIASLENQANILGLINQGFLRSKDYESKIVYFPTEKYFQRIGALSA